MENTTQNPIEFQLSTEFVELCNLLKLTGLADSGGRGKAMVAEGLVKVDGKLEDRKTAKIRGGQKVECLFDGKKIAIHVISQPAESTSSLNRIVR